MTRTRSSLLLLLPIAFALLWTPAARADTVRAHVEISSNSWELAFLDTENHSYSNVLGGSIPRTVVNIRSDGLAYDLIDEDEPSTRAFCASVAWVGGGSQWPPVDERWTGTTWVATMATATITVIDPDGTKRTVASPADAQENPYPGGFPVAVASTPAGIRCIPPCSVEAASPQEPTKPIVFTVKGDSAPCSAKLKKAVLKVGGKSYRYVKPKASQRVNAGETWRVTIRINGQSLKAVKKALGRGGKVTMRADFDIEGEIVSKTVRLGHGGSHGDEKGGGPGGGNGGNGGGGGQL